MACIEARGLRKAYGATVALDGVDLRVEEGRILGLIGPNGAGKSTALNAILGLTPYEGELQRAGPRSLDRARPADARRLLHRRRRGAAALDEGVAGARLRRRACTRASTARKAEAFLAKTDDQARRAGCGSCPRAWSRSCTWRW